MKPRFIWTISMYLCLFVLISGYIGWHGQVLLRYTAPDVPLWPYWIVYWIVAFSYLIARMAGKWLPGPLTYVLKLVGSYWMAVMLYSFLMLPIFDIAAVALWLASVSAADCIPLFASVYVVVILFVLVAGSRNAWSPVKRTYEVSVPKAAGAYKTLRVAVASDLHLGTIVGNNHLQRLVDRVNEMEPDLILLPGDVIDDDVEPFIRKRMGGVMKQFRSKLGVYAVLGNHEYFGGKIDRYVQEMKACGVEVLMDRTVKLADSFYLVGRKDKAAERFRPEGRLQLGALLADADMSLPVIVMDHQPYGLDKAAAAGVDINLSGHTHRGQMAPNHLITRRLFELDWGYLNKNGMHAIVSSGFGLWGPPIRIGSRSEWIELIIHFQGESSKPH